MPNQILNDDEKKEYVNQMINFITHRLAFHDKLDAARSEMRTLIDDGIKTLNEYRNTFNSINEMTEGDMVSMLRIEKTVKNNADKMNILLDIYGKAITFEQTIDTIADELIILVDKKLYLKEGKESEKDKAVELINKMQSVICEAVEFYDNTNIGE